MTTDTIDISSTDAETVSVKRPCPSSVDGVMQKMEKIEPKLFVKRLSEHAKVPVRGSPDAAGYDLFAAHDTVVPAHNRAVVPTDISIALPPGTYGRVAPRSGLAVKHFIDVGAGVVDRDYRGMLGIVLFNFGDQEFKVSRGDRIAQLVIERIMMIDVAEVEELDATTRGEGGFGSTGMN